MNLTDASEERQGCLDSNHEPFRAALFGVRVGMWVGPDLQMELGRVNAHTGKQRQQSRAKQSLQSNLAFEFFLQPISGSRPTQTVGGAVTCAGVSVHVERQNTLCMTSYTSLKR